MNNEGTIIEEGTGIPNPASAREWCVPIKPQRKEAVGNSNTYGGYCIRPTFDLHAEEVDPN